MATRKAPRSTAKKSATPAKAPRKASRTASAKRKASTGEARPPKPLVGTIAWRDLTVKNADAVRDFYAAVVGWKVVPLDMGGYSDYCMVPPATDTPEAGVCHKRGVNADIPSQWMMYVVVADLEASLAQCKRRGGKLVTPIRPQGASRFAVIKDPAGALLGLYEPGG